MFRGSYVQKIFVQKVLCSDGLIFRRSYVQKVLCSEIFIQKVLYSEGHICSEDPIFRNICLEGSISRRSYVQKVLYSEDPLFRRSYAGTHFHLSASGIKTSRVSSHGKVGEFEKNASMTNQGNVREFYEAVGLIYLFVNMNTGT